MNEITEIIKSITPGAVGAASGAVYTRAWAIDLFQSKVTDLFIFASQIEV